jgi:solute carrier family 45 protein 1/2/4
MFLTLISTSFDGTIVLVTLNGIPWAISNWIPFALIGKLTAGSKRFPGCEDPGIRANAESHSGGALIGLHNIAISAPQILAAGISSGILWLAKLGGSPYGAGWVLWAGGFAHLAAASIAFRFAVQSQLLIREGQIGTISRFE